ncbi:MAG: hypothetical protein HFI88_06875 [Lachnospiraceae bacterium]|nr:hypothetical protein [Lachnospiraceae bacterium]
MDSGHYIQRIESYFKRTHRIQLKGSSGIFLALYVFLIISIETFLVWEGNTPGLLLSFAFILAVLVFVCMIITKKVGILAFKMQKREMGRQGKIFWIVAFFSISFGVLFFWYTSYYPGAFSSDAIYQYEQALTGRYNDWKPILQTLITFTLPMKLTGKPESIVLFQIIEYSGVLTYMSYSILRYCNRPAAVLTLLYILLNPVTGNILIHPWKDVTFAMFAVLLMVFGLQIYITDGAWIHSKKSVIILGITLAVTTLVRHNGFFFTIPFLIAVFIHTNKKIRLQILFIVVICIGIVKGPLNHSLEVYESWNYSTRVLGLPMSVLGNIVKEAPEVLDDATETFVLSVASKEEWEESYVCGNFDSIKWICNQSAIEEAGAGKVLWMAAKASFKAPVAALKALFSLTDLVYTINGELDWNIPSVTSENTYGLELRNLYGGNAFGCYTDFSKTSILKYIFWYVGVINLIVISSLLCKCRIKEEKDRKKIAFVLPLLFYNFGTMLLLSSGLFKYFYLNFPICPLIILIIFGEKTEFQEESGNHAKRINLSETMALLSKSVSVWLKSAIALLKSVALIAKSNRAAAVFTFVLSGTIVIGEKLNREAPYISKFFFTDAIWLVFLWLLLFFTGVALIKQINRHLIVIQVADTQKKWWMGSFLLLILMWFPYLLAFYPGILSPDSITSMLQVKDLSILYNHIPIAYTLLVAFFVRLGWSIGGGNFGVALFSFSQLVIMAAILSYSVYWVRTRISKNKIISTVLLLFYGLNPIIALYSITMWKDVLFSGWIVLYCLFLGDVTINGEKEFIEKKGTIRLCMLFFLVSFGRNNGIYVIILSWLILLILYKKAQKKIFALCGGTILFILLIQGPGYKKLGIDQSGFAESVAIPLQQISYTAIHDRGFEIEDLEFLERIIPLQVIEDSYSPLSADNIKFNPEFNTAFFEENKAAFIKLYLKWFPSHFPSYVQSYLLSTQGFWHIDPTLMGWIVSDGVYENDLGIYSVDLLYNCLGIDVKQNMYMTMESVSRLPISNIGLMVWFVFFYILVCFMQKKPWKALVTMPLVGCWFTLMIASPVSSQFRYVYYYHLMIPIICILIFVKKKQAVEDGAIQEVNEQMHES